MNAKEDLKKLLTCLKKAGIDISTVSDLEHNESNLDFSVKVKDKEAMIKLDLVTGDVFYKYFTSSNQIGNISSPDKLTATIKKGIEPKKMQNGVDESKIKRLKELVEKAWKSLNEMSTTGTGASFNAGQGEQYATPFAFGKKGKALNRATKYLVKQGFMTAPDSLRFKAKSFDVTKWK